MPAGLTHAKGGGRDARAPRLRPNEITLTMADKKASAFAPAWSVIRRLLLSCCVTNKRLEAFDAYRRYSSATCDSAPISGSAMRLVRLRPLNELPSNRPMPMPAPNAISVSVPGFSRP